MCCASEAQFRAENNEITWKSLSNYLSMTWQSLGKAPVLHRKMMVQADPDDLVGSPLRILMWLRLILGRHLLLGPGHQERFRAKWIPVRVKKTRQNKRLEPGSDSIRTDKALEPNGNRR
jgi:hypothetical protein